jgi:GH15 family glucan-1,4-alpha-glucosidase
MVRKIPRESWSNSVKKTSGAVANLLRISISTVCPSLIALIILKIISAHSAESKIMPKLWPGYAILGNGTICAVYSDDAPLAPKSTLQGIQHLYYRDYTADYIASTTFQVYDEDNRICQRDPARLDSVGLENFFTTLTKSRLSDGVQLESRAFAHPNDAIILNFVVRGAPGAYTYRFRTRLLRRMVTDRIITLDRSAIAGNTASLSWPNGISLAIGTHSTNDQMALDDIGLVIHGPVEPDPVVVIIAAAESQERALENLENIRQEKDPWASAADHFASWLQEGIVPDFSDEGLLAAYRRNLYAALASNLNGQIPADLTGQFRTNNMPQLYPRDALMCARVFLLTGYPEEARQVLQFWADPRIPMKSPGEWYARYDAHGQAVEGGSGARYDEPEWDSNGYFIQLADAYHAQTGEWPVEPAFLYQLADFLVSRIDYQGLLYEGGIVEWTGYLPATNMIAAAALKTASRIAHNLGDSQREHRYHIAAERISTSLGLMFDIKRSTYADLRYSGRKTPDNRSLQEISGYALYLWDTSANFGVLWGYPDHEEIRQSNEFYAQHCVKHGGGLQYFDAPDPGLSGYGHDLFFFTTAAAAQYHARFGNPDRAKLHIDWMMKNANVYGLMPERIYLNGSGCSQASPLSWCCAEFAEALLEWHGAMER